MNAVLRLGRRSGLMLVAALSLHACSDGGTSPPVPSAIQANGVLPGAAAAGSVLTPSVKVTDSRGRAVAGTIVTFQITSGGGSIANASAATDASGIAAAGDWTLGTGLGANTLVASYGTLTPVTIVVTGTAGAAANIEPIQTNTATATAGLAVAVPLGVRVTDQYGNPVMGVQVTFSTAAGSGVVTGSLQSTAADGTARPTNWTLGPTAGIQTLNVSAGTLTTTLTLEAQPGPAATLVRLSPAAQTAAPGAAVAAAPSVRAQDQFGNVVSGVTVTFAVTGGAGSITGGTQTTDAAGVATLGSWTLGAAPGPNTLAANVVGGGTTSFSAQGVDPNAAVLEKFAGDATTCPINRNGCVFSVRVSQGGQPVSGENVVWSNGSGTTNSTVTNLRGIATAGNIGPNSTIGARTQTATLQSTGEQVTFGYTLVADGGYNIDIRYIGALPSPAVQAAFLEARLRWEAIITGEISNVQMNNIPADQCGTHPPINETVDDLLVFVVVDSIDGPGKVLGSAGPCFIRNSNNLPIVGRMRLDSADLAVLAGNGRLRDVVLHELGHTLGFPGLWGSTFFGYLNGAGTADPYYTGDRGRSAFQLAGGTLITGVGVPVENTGGSGTRDAHWRESVLSTELMTGFISGTSNPLSALTIGSLMDIGYQVNFGAADAYLLPGASVRVGATADAYELVEIPLPAPRVIR